MRCIFTSSLLSFSIAPRLYKSKVATKGINSKLTTMPVKLTTIFLLLVIGLECGLGQMSQGKL